MLQLTLQSLATAGTATEGKNNQQNPKHKHSAAINGEKEGKSRTTGEKNTPRAEEGYCNETAHSGPSVHTDRATKPKNIERK